MKYLVRSFGPLPGLGGSIPVSEKKNLDVLDLDLLGRELGTWHFIRRGHISATWRPEKWFQLRLTMTIGFKEKFLANDNKRSCLNLTAELVTVWPELYLIYIMIKFFVRSYFWKEKYEAFIQLDSIMIYKQGRSKTNIRFGPSIELAPHLEAKNILICFYTSCQGAPF